MIGGVAIFLLGLVLGSIYMHKEQKILKEIQKTPMVSLFTNSDRLTLSLEWSF